MDPVSTVYTRFFNIVFSGVVVPGEVGILLIYAPSFIWSGLSSKGKPSFFNSDVL